MSEVLGKVTRDLDAPRGADVEFRVQVRRAWLGRKVQVTLPRTLHCASCGGGGCDRCQRAGAVSLTGKGQPGQTVEVALPALPEESRDVCLRLPEQGGVAVEEGRPRGHLLLTLRLAEHPSEQVVLIDSEPPSEFDRAALMRQSLWVAAGLIALFVFLLWFSGWL